MSFNSRLLTIFTNKSKRYTLDLESIRNRFEALSLIYVNLITTFLIFLYDFIIWMFFSSFEHRFRMVFTSPLIIISFILLKAGKEKAAVIASLLYMHFVNYCLGRVFGQPMTGISGQIFVANFSCFLYANALTGTLNLILCIVQFASHCSKVLTIYAVTLDDDQKFHIYTLIVSQLACLIFIPMLFLVRRAVDDNTWTTAKINFLKSENLTKGIVQTVEANDSLIFTLSEELKKIIALVEKKLVCLSQSTQKPAEMENITNIKKNTTTIMNILDNALDTAKLRAGRMEDTTKETNLADTFRSTFNRFSELLSWSKLTVNVQIDKSLPQRIWLDSANLMKIIMNLIPIDVQPTNPNLQRRNKMNIYAAWYHESTDRNGLLIPLKETRDDHLQSIQSINAIQYRNSSPNIQLIRNSSSSPDEAFEEFELEESRNRDKNFSMLITRPTKQLVSSVATSTVSQEAAWNIQEGWSLKNGNSESASAVDTHFNKSSERKGFLKIQVVDSRYEIPQSEISQLFEGNNQASASRTVSGGLKLRLWVCKQLCLRMGGDFKVESKPNCGTTFTFYILVDNSRFFVPLERDRRVTRRAGTTALIVDDSSFNKNLHKILLEKEGVRVTLATNDQEALDIFKEKGVGYFDFAMIGLQMPTLNGYKAAKRIREYEKEQRRDQFIDIYFVSSEHYDEYEILKEYKTRERMNDLNGIKGFVKPLDLGILKKALTRYRKNENFDNN